jgi:hypothetical protein
MVRGAEFRATIGNVERDVFGKSPLYESWLTEVDGVPLGLATYFFCYSTFNSKVNQVFYLIISLYRNQPEA